MSVWAAEEQLDACTLCGPMFCDRRFSIAFTRNCKRKTLDSNDQNQVADQRFSLKQWFAGGAQSRGLRKPGCGHCYLRFFTANSLLTDKGIKLSYAKSVCVSLLRSCSIAVTGKNVAKVKQVSLIQMKEVINVQPGKDFFFPVMIRGYSEKIRMLVCRNRTYEGNRKQELSP